MGLWYSSSSLWKRILIPALFQVGLWIDAGSRYENERNNGTAHFLEHMAFKVRWQLRSKVFKALVFI